MNLEKENIRIIEALLFCTQESLTQAQVNSCFDNDDVPSLNDAVKALNEEYEKSDRSFEIEKAGIFKFLYIFRIAWIFPRP